MGPMGLMLVEFEGNVKVYLAAFMYMACSALKRVDNSPWTTLHAVNAARTTHGKLIAVIVPAVFITQ
eukprot:4694830-Pleurochrysis_carterae.AAC.1